MKLVVALLPEEQAFYFISEAGKKSYGVSCLSCMTAIPIPDFYTAVKTFLGLSLHFL